MHAEVTCTQTHYLSMSQFFLLFFSLSPRLSIRMSLPCASQSRCLLFIACDLFASCPTIIVASEPSVQLTDRSLSFSLTHQRTVNSTMVTCKTTRRAIEWVATAVRHCPISSVENKRGKVTLRLSVQRGDETGFRCTSRFVATCSFVIDVRRQERHWAGTERPWIR